jgi:hypothetical protein
MEFEDYGDLDEHLEKIVPCSPEESTAANSYEIGISRRTMEKLKSKRRSGEEQTEIDRWREVYKLLFPERIIIPTPCETSCSYFKLLDANLLPVYDFDMSCVRPASSNSTDRLRLQIGTLRTKPQTTKPAPSATTYIVAHIHNHKFYH